MLSLHYETSLAQFVLSHLGEMQDCVTLITLTLIHGTVAHKNYYDNCIVLFSQTKGGHIDLWDCIKQNRITSMKISGPGFCKFSCINEGMLPSLFVDIYCVTSIQWPLMFFFYG